MVFKIRTSKKAMEYFEAINSSENLPPFILSKLAIAMSLKNQNPLNENDFKTDTLGLELNRQTITGEYDDLFKCLIEMYEKKHLNDDEYFQKYLKAHLDRGAQMIYGEYKYGRDFLLQLLKSEKSL
ncbi:DndE family protein [bacterium]|nr:DndE family protein [bacterium]